MPAAVPALIGAIGSIGGSVLGRPRARTSTQTQTPIYSPEQTQINAMIAKMLGRQLKRGGEVPQWMRNQGRGQINSLYDAMLKRLQTSAAHRGFAGSGVEGRNIETVETGRVGAMQELEGDLLSQEMNRYMQLLGLGINFGQPRGQKTEGQTSGMGIGEAIGGAIPGIAGDIATDLWLRRILKHSAPVSSSDTLRGIVR